MATMLDLPRELYLMICDLLKPTELTKLAGVSRDHYLAVQQPLYAQISITSYGALIKLVATLGKIPVVSRISPQQRLKWFKLSDAQLQERNIKRLDLLLDGAKDGDRITGAILANCVGAISRKCFNVKITLTIQNVWPNFVKQLSSFGLANVSRLVLFLGRSRRNLRTLNDSEEANTASHALRDLIFSGTTFPDLRSVYVNTRASSARNLPTTLAASVGPAISFGADEQSSPDSSAPMYGLRNLEELILSHDLHFNEAVLHSLFASSIVPTRLTKLEIVDCQRLHPIDDLGALSKLLERALQLVQSLKLHLCTLFNHGSRNINYWGSEYALNINEHPEHHLCNLVRNLGQNIPSLDIAVPFACNRLFVQPPKTKQVNVQVKEYPSIAREPLHSLPDRLKVQGYKYRRLICWHGVCRGAHHWEDMIGLASEQRGQISWEMLYAPEDRGSWHVSGCLPVEYSAFEELDRNFTAV